MLFISHSNATSDVEYTAADAKKFIVTAEKTIQDLAENNGDAYYLMEVNPNYDTKRHSAMAMRLSGEATTRLALEAVNFDGVELDHDSRRRLNFIKLALTSPVPENEKNADKYASNATSLRKMYSKGQFCQKGSECLDLKTIGQKMNSSREHDELLTLWQGAQQISRPMRSVFQEQVTFANEGANRLGYNNTGALWRSHFEMPAADFSNELERSWHQVKPLYNALQCHVRAKLSEQYGSDKVALNKPIPAHLLGSFSANNWTNLYDLIESKPITSGSGYDITQLLNQQNYDRLKMVRSAENFWTSLGFNPFPDTLYERSTITERNGDPSCHQDTWVFGDELDDMRIQMCLDVTKKDFTHLHKSYTFFHYMGAQTNLAKHFRNIAANGFYSALRETIQLSLTPTYLKDIGLLDKLPDQSYELGNLMALALDKVTAIPYSMVADKWRQMVFSGEISPENYNQSWWQLREEYQGISAPETVTEDDFDASMIANIAFNRPDVGSGYMPNLFLENMLQFQFHKSLCDLSNNKEALHRCSIYNSKKAGKHLNDMFKIGTSQHWSKSLVALTGQSRIDGSAMVEYFAPLKAYLDEQNKDRQCGW